MRFEEILFRLALWIGMVGLVASGAYAVHAQSKADEFHALLLRNNKTLTQEQKWCAGGLSDCSMVAAIEKDGAEIARISEEYRGRASLFRTLAWAIPLLAALLYLSSRWILFGHAKRVEPARVSNEAPAAAMAPQKPTPDSPGNPPKHYGALVLASFIAGFAVEIGTRGLPASIGEFQAYLGAGLGVLLIPYVCMRRFSNEAGWIALAVVVFLFGYGLGQL